LEDREADPLGRVSEGILIENWWIGIEKNKKLMSMKCRGGQSSIKVREVQHRQRQPLTAAIWLNQFPGYVANSSKESAVRALTTSTFRDS